MGDDMPADPVGGLAEGAAQLHELYLTYLTAGFTEKQALYLIAQIMIASIQGQADA